MQWGAFSHDGTTKQKFYKISAKILGNNIPLEIFMSLERFFHKVYVEDDSIIPLVQNEYNQQQKVANKLFNMSDDEWEKYGYIINQPKASERIKPLNQLNPEDDIIIEFNGDQNSLEYTNDFLVPLQKIIDQTDDAGGFEYGPFLITINKKINRASEYIKISNPDIKPEHLYHIH
jgi:hypothetical protein